MLIVKSIKKIIEFGIAFVLFCICLGFIENHAYNFRNSYFFHRPSEITRVGVPNRVTTPARDYRRPIHGNASSNKNNQPNTDTPYNSNATCVDGDVNQ